MKPATYLCITVVIISLLSQCTYNGKLITQKIKSQNVWFNSNQEKPIKLEGVLCFKSKFRNLPLVILCHPNPLHGGSMDSVVIRALEDALLKNKFSTLRFNFRGVGNSEGFYGHGIMEEKDLEGAIKFAFKNNFIKPEKVIIVGYSFGASVAFKVALKNSQISKLVTIGLDNRIVERKNINVRNKTLKICFIAGEFDKYACNLTILMEFCKRNNLSCNNILIEGADHFFTVNLNKLVSSVVAFCK